MPPSAITLEELSDYFHMPEKIVAQKMGMCLTSLKKVCRAHGITRWPFRKLKSLERTMQKVSADSDSISAQLGKDGAAARSTSSKHGGSSDSSRAASPVKLNCCSEQTVACPVDTLGTPTPVFAPRAESAVRDSARLHTGSGGWPAFTISGLNMTQLIITNWSDLWTIAHLNQYIVKPLGAEMTISEDGSKAYLGFLSSLAAVQARNVCEEACDLLRARALAAEAYVKMETTARPAMVIEDEDTPIESEKETGFRFLEQPATKNMFATDTQEEDGSSWMNLAAPSSTNRWVASLLSPPQSCGSQSDEPDSLNSRSSAHSSNQEWLSPCLVSC